MKQTRREWLTTTAAIALPMFIPRTVFAQGNRPGANERLGIAAIGVGRQGDPVLRNILRDRRTTAICVCDVWKRRASEVAARHNVPPEHVYQDYRKVIERKDVDAIMIATNEQWRGPICVSAALAGKHLFVEKPVTLTIDDGKRMRAAAKKTGIKFQSGSMQRSDRVNDLACRFIREGHLGKIHEIHCANYESPWLYGMSAEPIPEDLDWDMWCGPAEPVAYHRELFVPRGRPGWLSFREFSGGEMTGWGTHGFDQVQCALGLDDTGPVEIFVEGDKLVPPVFDQPTERRVGDAICAKPMLAFKYADGPLVKMNLLDIHFQAALRGGAIFFGEKGKIEIIRGGMTSEPKELAEDWLREYAEHRLPIHEVDWINCIYNGR
ncbi:MAG: Gfo/Idh/MocA family oxidoreductase, partial [Planctomycetaceae bacterium]|nr:Gfo/Idh/MocA family oxidoreductase [Planctomycetaceae bacterium]